MQLQPGTLILNGKFRIRRRLGGGASAEVYEATQVGLDAPRALKILRRDLPGVGSTEVTEYAARFALEGRLQARLKGHPRIVQVYDTDSLDDAPVLIMEYCEGGSLETELDEAARRGQPLSVGRVVEVLQDIADGLAELHRLNCVHRDIKPGNILLDGGGRAKIGDLGLAQVAGLPSVDRSGRDVPRHPGTPGYASPEHAVAQAYLTPRADLFALGVVGYRMLTGRIPDGTPPARRPRADRADVPDWLDALLLRMLALDPRQRPEDGGAVAEEIRRERRAEAERALARAAQAVALRGRIEDALKAGRLVESDTLMDELLQLDADDLTAQTLARRVNRALVEEKQRLAREERLRHDEERARSKREDEERQAHLAEAEVIGEQERQAETFAWQHRETEQRRQREAEEAAAIEQKRNADEAAWQRREEEQRQRLAAEAKRQAAPQPLSAPARSPAPPPTGPNTSRRAVLIGAGTVGALGLGWLATRGGERLHRPHRRPRQPGYRRLRRRCRQVRAHLPQPRLRPRRLQRGIPCFGGRASTAWCLSSVPAWRWNSFGCRRASS